MNENEEAKPAAVAFEGESLSDRMKGQEFTFNPPGTQPEPVVIEAPKPDVPEPRETPAPDATPTDDVDDVDDLPVFGSKQKVDKPEEVLGFDAQTEDIAKLIESKGHAGDEYRRLRAELKILKEKKPIEDLDSIPEVQTLRQKAQEAEILRAEADALRERNKQLLQVNNEVAVKEGDDYINLVKKPIKAIEDTVMQIAKGSDIDPSTIFSIISETDIIKQDKMLEAVHKELGSRTAGRIERFCEDYKAALSKGEQLLSEHGKNAERARIARDEAVRAEQLQKVELFKSSVEASFTKYAKSVPGYTDSSGNLTDVAQAALHNATTVDIASLGADDIGYLAFTASALPEARRAIAELRKENAILRGTRKPTAPIAGKPALPTDPSDDYVGLTDRMRGMEFTFTPPS